MVAHERTVRHRLTGLVACLLLLPASAAIAQTQGRLTATVVDAGGEPMPGVEVSIHQEEIGFDKTVETNRRGRFNLVVIDATRVYTFEFSKEGMPKVIQQYKLDVGGVSHHTFRLAPGAGQPAPSSPSAPPAPDLGNRAIGIYNEGVQALQSEDEAVARAKFEEVVEIAPEMPEPYRILASLYIEAEEYDRAIAAAEKLLELSPDHPAALVVLHDAHSAQGDSATAERYLDRMTAAGSGKEAAVRVYNGGAEAVQAGNLDAAIDLFAKAVELDAELGPAHAALARLLIARERWDEALASADAALALDPSLLDMQRVRYQAYRSLGRQDEAREVFEQIAAADPEGLAESLYEQGKTAFEAGENAQALQALEQAVAANPDHARAHYMLGLAYANSGDNAKAKQHLERFIELAPDDPEVGSAREMIGYLG